MYALEIRNITKRFGSLLALNEINFSIEPGQFFGLLGPNGAGKTTLISILSGLSRATEGQVKIMGHDVVTDYKAARQALGVVPQELVFDPFFTVRETLRIQSGYYGIAKNDDWIDEVLTHLGLLDKANVNMRLLSGGMKRRVLVAQALVHRPPVIVLDEPTAGVDVELRRTLWQFITQLNKAGHTIVLTTHYLEEAENFCTHLAMLKRGEIIALETTESLLNRFACLKLVLRLSSGHLPENLLALAKITTSTTSVLNDKNVYTFTLNSYEDVEPILQQCRLAGCHLAEVDICKADLEDVFVQLMHEPKNTNTHIKEMK